jgi:hypothetical protein
MSEKLYEALEVCLNALDTGVEIEAVLNLYPDLADELRPILETAVQAHSLATTSVPKDTVNRGRARVLQHAAGMREAAAKPRSRWSMFAFPRLATSLAIALVFLLSGTGLVSASTQALPGDSLYPVKRSWEDLRLFFIFSPEAREGLESEFEQERLDEISELLTEGRNETIAFAGLVTEQGEAAWKVSGITVMITPSSLLPSDTVPVGAPVMVIGHTNAQGFVEVDTLDVMGPGASLPPLEPSEDEEQHAGESDVNGNQQPEQLGEMTYEFQGVVEAKNGNIWTINGQRVNVGFAENRVTVPEGVIVEFEGYYSVDGQFIVTKIEIKSSGLLDNIQLEGSSKNSDGSGKKSDGGGGAGGGDNGNDDDSSDNNSDDSDDD